MPNTEEKKPSNDSEWKGCLKFIVIMLAVFVGLPILSLKSHLRSMEKSRTKAIQIDLKLINDAYEEYYRYYDIKPGDNNSIPSLQDLCDKNFLRVLPQPVVGDFYSPPKLILSPETAKNPNAYPTFHGPDPDGNRKHPGYLEEIGQA